MKKLPHDAKGWHVSNRELDALYLDVKLDKIPGVKDVKMNLLAKSGISTIQDLIGLDKADIKHIAKKQLGFLTMASPVSEMLPVILLLLRMHQKVFTSLTRPICIQLNMALKKMCGVLWLGLQNSKARLPFLVFCL